MRDIADNIVVSLTTFPARIGNIGPTLESLFNQTVKPGLIELWLAKEQFEGEKLPDEITNCNLENFEIKWCEDLRSYKKLIPALREHPDKIIVTVDDDIIFDKKMLEILIAGHEAHPDCIVCHRVTKFYFRNGYLLNRSGGAECYREPSFLNKLAGGAGCLYPPGVLNDEVCNSDIFEKYASTNDDLWFWFMAIKAGTKIYRVNNAIWNIKTSVSIAPLSMHNDGDKRLFYRQLDNLLHLYPEVEDALKHEYDSRDLGKPSRIGMIESLKSSTLMRPVYALYLKKRNDMVADISYIFRVIDGIQRDIHINDNCRE